LTSSTAWGSTVTCDDATDGRGSRLLIETVGDVVAAVAAVNEVCACGGGAGVGVEGRLAKNEANGLGILECDEDVLEVELVAVVLMVEIGRAPGRGGSGGFGAWVLGGSGSIVKPFVMVKDGKVVDDVQGSGGSFRRADVRVFESCRALKRGDAGWRVDVNVTVFLPVL
jgi:hypothetical protein